MLPVNDYQKVLYEALKKTNYKVFDEVPADEDLPLMMISDYTLDEGNTKLPGYKIIQSIDLIQHEIIMLICIILILM